MYEIERKYIVTSETWRNFSLKQQTIRQGYFRSEDATIRIRLVDDDAYLTIKGRPQPGGFTRAEFEYAIPVEDALKMLEEFCHGHFVEKTRHHLTCCGSHWIVDEFVGKLEGLILAEIELESEEEEFQEPEWLGKEVTHDYRYSNSQLAQNDTPPK